MLDVTQTIRSSGTGSAAPDRPHAVIIGSGFGGLAHEEAPMTLAPLILRHAVLWGVLPS